MHVLKLQQAALCAALGTRCQEDLRRRIGEHDSAHVAPVGHEAGPLAEATLDGEQRGSDLRHGGDD